MGILNALPTFFSQWLDATSLFIFLLVFLLAADYIKNRAPKNFPPGPWSLPFVGNIFNIDPLKPHIYMCKLAERYGNIFSLRLGRDKAVVVNGFKMVKEALVNQGDIFAGRTLTPVFERINRGQGLSMSNGYMWKQQRRFAMSTFRNFGVGKKTLESTIQEESRCLLEAIMEKKGLPFDPHLLLNNAVANIISSVIFGRRFEYSDTRFQKLLDEIFEALYLDGSVWGQLYNAFPTVMKRLPGRHNDIFRNYKKVVAFLRQQIQTHRDNWEPSEPRDYMDSYFAEIIKRQDDPEAQFDDENLCYCTLDLIIAGTETSSTTLRWALLYMMKHQQVQEKVHEEIDRVIGQARQPSMDDRPNMPYTDAVIHEVQRISNIVPLNLPRLTTKDTTLGGYFIPEGTQIIPNLTSVLFDKNEWETPDSFNPRHFLDASGAFVRKEAFMPFSAGQRICLGENLAKMELFLFFTSLLQKFTFHSPAGVEPSFGFQVGLTLSPLPFQISASVC
ncbi:cytochrome P450 2J2-like [Polypterus senegalus]|uniref:cytochrome P450 2J2-like n=1 Tax=Polypterus senegalus TaxID=55291 RepID=UPI001965484B|nr:cytochrome P450 2J2-like [Polypterus senegalus]